MSTCGKIGKQHMHLMHSNSKEHIEYTTNSRSHIHGVQESKAHVGTETLQLSLHSFEISWTPLLEVYSLGDKSMVSIKINVNGEKNDWTLEETCFWIRIYIWKNLEKLEITIFLYWLL